MDRILAPFKSLYAKTRGGNLLKIISRYSDMLFPLGVMLAIATFFVPLPSWLLTYLVIINLGISFIVLSTSLYINTPLQLTTYPTILLLSTLLRMCLSVSIMRSVISKGEAGAMIEALGKLTMQGNLVVGVVMFTMILVVQFIVVAKGAERVAEVGARFTLDAMPGKQMSIDADMRSGLITQDQARLMRSALQRESQLYGAMDGAMKFVKGDSIATIIIALINVVAGIGTGVFQHSMGFSDAAHKYMVMTIGDGLSAIISSLLVTVSAAIVVTRVSTDDETTNIGGEIGAQLFSNPKPLMLASGLLLTLAVFPSTPTLPLLLVGGLAAAGAYKIHTTHKERERLVAAESERHGVVADGEDLQPTFAVPLAVVVNKNITHLIDKETASGARFREELPKLRSATYYDIGVLLPNTHISGDAPLKDNQYFIALKEVPVVYGFIKPNSVYVNDSAANIRAFGIEGEDILNPADLKPGAWIPSAQRSVAELAGLKVWEPVEVITLHLSLVLKKYAHEFVGIQEAQAYLDFAARGVPKLVEEVVPKIVTVNQFTDVLQRLVQEGISIRDIKTILDALSEWGRVEKDPVMLTEHIRGAMKRYISFRYTGGRDSLFVYLIDPEIEDVIRGAIRRTSTGSFLSLDPAIAHDILDAVRREIGNKPATAQKPVIITDMELRRFVRKTVELEFPTLSVLSYQELAPELNIQPVGRITMRPAAENFVTSGNYDEQLALTGGTPPAALAETLH